ncbi:MAG: type VI secretion system tip protein VgrG [Chitinophagales bacterium]
MINFRNKPKFKLAIPYIIQYNETDYEFIKRLASQFGEWFYFDGDRFVFGEHQKGKKSELRLKENLLRIELNLNIVPIPDPIQMYNYNETQPYKKDKVNYPNIDSEDAIKTLNKSNQLFNSQHKKAYHSISELQAESQQVLDHYGDSIAGKGANDLANITGISDAFGISVGSSVKWLDRNMIEEVNRGEYVVIEANHTVNKNGDYRVNFKGVPVGNEFPPNDHEVKIPKATPEIGTVIDNHDDKGLGRVRVQFHWMDGDQTTLWIRLSAAGAGAGRGFYFVPEVGDEVIVGYEHGNPDMPFVMGTTYNAHTTPGSKSSAGNDIKGLMTRTGHTIELNDSSSPGITIKDSGGNCINIDCNSNTVTITSLGNLNLVAGADMNLMAKGNISIDAKKNVRVGAAENSVEVQAMQDINLKATKNIQLKATENIRLEAVQKLNMRGDAKAAIRSAANVVIDGGANTHVSAKDKVYVKGNKVDVHAASTLEIMGSDVEINKG